MNYPPHSLLLTSELHKPPPYGLYIKVMDREGIDIGLAGNLSCGKQLHGVCVF